MSIVECFHCHRSEIEKPVDKTCACYEPACLGCAAECISEEYEEWEPCDWCGGDGTSGHDCGEDTCCCLEPEENVTCHICDGKGGWKRNALAVAQPVVEKDGK